MCCWRRYADPAPLDGNFSLVEVITAFQRRAFTMTNSSVSIYLELVCLHASPSYRSTLSTNEGSPVRISSPIILTNPAITKVIVPAMLQGRFAASPEG